MREEGAEIYSEKYNLTGRVVRYGMSNVLCFEYEGKKVAMAVSRNSLRDNSLATMEAYVELFAPDAVKGRKLQLHNWYLFRDAQTGELHAHGNISGSLEKEDTARVDTDAIWQIHDNRYGGVLKDCFGNLLLVGINYDKNAAGEKAKRHTCVVERV